MRGKDGFNTLNLSEMSYKEYGNMEVQSLKVAIPKQSSDRYLAMFSERTAELLGHTERVLHLSLSPDGSTVISAGADETLR